MSLLTRGNKDTHHRSSRRQIALRATIPIIMIFVLGMFVTHFTGTAPKAHAAGWTEVWSDEFNGPAGSQPSTANWLYDTGTCYPGCPAANWGTGEVESMTTSPANVSEDGNGHLVITAINNGGSWTSGRIETQNTSFAAPPGGEMAVEASIQQPNVTTANGAGYWPAFWMLGSAFRGVYTNWPGIGEIDAMEDVNGLSSEFGTLHCGVDPGGPCNETTGYGSGQYAASGLQTSFHTYRVEVDRSVSPEQIRWYLDGVNFFTAYENHAGMDPTTWANAVDHSFFIIFDLAMGGGFPGAFGGGPNGSTVSGASMLVDYVRVYTSGGSSPTPTPVATATSTGGCNSGNFTQGVTAPNATTALTWFQPCGWTAGYVILHYTIAGQPQQNVNMSYNSGTARWEYSVPNISPGQTMAYSFTYQKSGLQYDTGSSSWTQPSGSGATPTPAPTATPTCNTGGFQQSVASAGSTQATFTFSPCGWSAGYVILHYTIAGQVQQNVNMTNNGGQWTYTAGGFSAGASVTYSFTYQQNGLQYDTGTYSWTHP